MSASAFKNSGRLNAMKKGKNGGKRLFRVNKERKISQKTNNLNLAKIMT